MHVLGQGIFPQIRCVADSVTLYYSEFCLLTPEFNRAIKDEYFSEHTGHHEVFLKLIPSQIWWKTEPLCEVLMAIS
jgi:hypothetical protein